MSCMSWGYHSSYSLVWFWVAVRSYCLVNAQWCICFRQHRTLIYLLKLSLSVNECKTTQEITGYGVTENHLWNVMALSGTYNKILRFYWLTLRLVLENNWHNIVDSTLRHQQPYVTISIEIFFCLTQYHPAVPYLKEILTRKWYLIQQQPLPNQVFKETPMISYR